jgi:FAD/FMN-containing dehydrogenase
MSSHNTLAVAAATILLVAVTMGVLRRDQSRNTPTSLGQAPKELPQPTKIALDLKAALPEAVTLSSEADAFNKITESYWARQNREVFPACYVQPRSIEQLQEAVKLLKQEYVGTKHAKRQGNDKGLFVVKGGGASPAVGLNNVNSGVVIDLARFRDITYTDDYSHVTVGCGLKWKDLYEDLEPKPLTVAGGRTVPVGVAGLTLQGGMSFYSPVRGFVCSTVTEYNIVLADGSAVVASETSYPDLWRALKGGSNNFGIVTSFTIPCFPSSDMWFTCNYTSGFQAPSLVKAFYDYAREASSGRPGAFDEHATIPITCFGYTRDLGVHATANYLGYTVPPKDKKWPAYWKNSPFGTLWNLWSTAKVRSLLSVVREQSEQSPPGTYTIFVVTTIKNDLDTLMAAYTAYREASAAGKRVKGMVLSLALQPILPQWYKNGQPNVLGLDDCNEPLVIAELTIKWDKTEHMELVQHIARQFIERVDKAAEDNQAAHPFRFANYCAEWQDPMKGYGEENLQFMRTVSRKYDPEGVFQRACIGGFKLGVDYD